MNLFAMLTERRPEDWLSVIDSITVPIDGLELRLDILESFDIEHIRQVLSKIKQPLILSFRSKKVDLESIKLLLELSPAYLDLGEQIDLNLIQSIKALNPSVILMQTCSQHFYHPDIELYRFSIESTSTLDIFKMISFLKKNFKKGQFTIEDIGPYWINTLILGQIIGSEVQSIPVECLNTELFEIYRLREINFKTKVFALLGDPIDHSIGHLFHNQAFLERGINAVYLKLCVSSEDLPECFKLIQKLPFEGLSITMPLKEAVLPFVDQFESGMDQIGAINTILFKGGQVHATNTDGSGAVDAVEPRRLIRQSHVLLIGAGGAAKAIAAEIQARCPLSLMILNRSLSKALLLSEHVDATAYDYSMIRDTPLQKIDIMINTVPTSEAHERLIFDLLNHCFSEKMIYMSIDYSKPDGFLMDELKQRNCILISPKEMYVNQALRQLAYWLN